MRLTALALALSCAIFTTAARAEDVAGCSVFPPDNIWNTPIDTLPVDEHSDAYVESIGADDPLKGDFGAGLYEGRPMGIPYTTVPFKQEQVEINFTDYEGEEAVPAESDAGPYPVPADAPIEGGTEGDGDRHVLVVQEGSCTLFELYKAVLQDDGSWNAVGAAKFDLEGNGLRMDGWTSVDAAGLPILPGLIRANEVEAGEINHALRFTAPRTQQAYVWPARHYASDDTDENLPPMGQRFRLKADVDIAGYSPPVQVILTALKTYGMMLADNGSAWFMSGEPNDYWDNDMLNAELKQLKGSDFEAVDVSELMVDPDSAEAKQP